jgi:hypothetical protein
MSCILSNIGSGGGTGAAEDVAEEATDAVPGSVTGVFSLGMVKTRSSPMRMTADIAPIMTTLFDIGVELD